MTRWSVVATVELVFECGANSMDQRNLAKEEAIAQLEKRNLKIVSGPPIVIPADLLSPVRNSA